MKKLLLLLLVFPILQISAQHNIIPAPISFSTTSESFNMEKGISLFTNTEDDLSNIILSRIQKELNTKGVQSSFVGFESVASAKGMYFLLNDQADNTIGKEGYKLNVSNQRVEIVANEPAGLLYGFESFKQLLPAVFHNYKYSLPEEGIAITGCSIVDQPRFEWRGLMLDVSRHFFSVEDVKAYIDAMAAYKMNTLHWHLTDDNGWRIEIKSLPKLTEVGAWRVERYEKYGDRKDPQPNEPATYGGFYTHEQIKEVVTYAAERNITIVPEIDVPGHSMAALAAYPELSTLKEKKYVNPGTKFSEWYGDGTFKMLIENTLNPADEKVYEFLDKVFKEVAMLFPGQYIHVGGDECDHRFWEADEGCKALMQKEGLKNGHELQGYFMKRTAEIITKYGKKVIGWDEILDGELPDGAAVMSWRGMKGGIEAAKRGNKVVMSPTTFAYLDYTQGDHSHETKIYADLSLRKAYSFEPVPEGINSKLILGGQGNLWTEQIPTLDHAFYMTYPRAMAIAERVWSPKTKENYSDFLQRLEYHFDVFEAEDRNISKAIYDPIVEVKKENDKLMVSLSSDIQDSEIYYTTDFTFPNHRTLKYIHPIEIPEGNVRLKVINYRNGKSIGRLLDLHREELEERAGR